MSALAALERRRTSTHRVSPCAVGSYGGELTSWLIGTITTGAPRSRAPQSIAEFDEYNLRRPTCRTVIRWEPRPYTADGERIYRENRRSRIRADYDAELIWGRRWIPSSRSRNRTPSTTHWSISHSGSDFAVFPRRHVDGSQADGELTRLWLGLARRALCANRGHPIALWARYREREDS